MCHNCCANEHTTASEHHPTHSRRSLSARVVGTSSQFVCTDAVLCPVPLIRDLPHNTNAIASSNSRITAGILSAAMPLDMQYRGASLASQTATLSNWYKQWVTMHCVVSVQAGVQLTLPGGDITLNAMLQDSSICLRQPQGGWQAV